MKPRIKTAVLISGNGTNLKALYTSSKQSWFPAEIALVISNVPNVNGLTFANENKIPTVTIDHKLHTREVFENLVHACLQEHNIQLICLAGFMRILTEPFVSKWKNRILNVHPSLLPSFRGANAVEQALSYGVQWSGCTVHFVVPELDAGPIIYQQVVPVHSQDTVEILQQRIQEQEYILYQASLAKVSMQIQRGEL